jgi:hypothetical protein
MPAFVLAVVCRPVPFLAASPALAGTVFGGLFAFTVWFSKRAHRIGEQLYEDCDVVFPSLPTVAPADT